MMTLQNKSVSGGALIADNAREVGRGDVTRVQACAEQQG